MPKQSLYLQGWYVEEYDQDRFGGAFGRYLHDQEVETFLSLIDGSPGMVLDVGAGTGKLSLALMRRSRQAISADMSPAMLRIAKRKAAQEGMILRPVICDTHDLCFRDDSFKCAVASRVLMHLADWRGGLSELCRAAQSVVVDFPPLCSFSGLDSLFMRYKSLLRADIPAYKALRIRDVNAELRRHNFQTVLLQKQFFLPIAFHRWLNSPRLSSSIEKLCRTFGLVRLFGAPVTIKAVKVGGEQMNMNRARPWQLEMFDKSLKKKMKIKTLKRFLGDLDGKHCFMVTCGDNNGAMNYHLREAGGRWTWAEFEEDGINQIEELLKEPVIKLNRKTCELPFHDASFDCIVIIDCHEHLDDPLSLTKELSRITKPGGKVVISVPNGDERMLAVKIKNLIGMTKEKYGHIVTGYDIPALSYLLQKSGLKPIASDSYVKFFTEMLELCINFAYVMILSKKTNVKIEAGTIAPSNKEQLESAKKSYKLYTFIYPIFRLISNFDALLFFTKGYAVVVEARKE